MNNRLANCHNKFQTQARRVLCVCSAGLLRSPTMANTLHKEFGFNTRAAGHSDEYALIPTDGVLLEWADQVVCANFDVFKAMTDKHGKIDDCLVLDLPDSFEWNDARLKEEIIKQFNKAVQA